MYNGCDCIPPLDVILLGFMDYTGNDCHCALINIGFDAKCGIE